MFGINPPPPGGLPDLNLGGFTPQLGQQPKPSGMFGAKGKDALLMAAAGFMSRRNPQMAQMLMQPLLQRQQDARERAHRQQQLQDEETLYSFKQQNSQPEYGEFERALIASGVQPGTPQWQEMMQRRRDNMLDPIVNTMQGPVLRSMVTNSLQPPSAPVGKLTPIDDGGAGPAAPRPFPY